jgi:hypothetical protein
MLLSRGFEDLQSLGLSGVGGTCARFVPLQGLKASEARSFCRERFGLIAVDAQHEGGAEWNGIGAIWLVWAYSYCCSVRR